MGDRVNANEICRSQGFPGQIADDYGGNWGSTCRYPGTQKGSPNKAGGSLTSFGYTVSWRCLGKRMCDGKPITPAPNLQTKAPTPGLKCPLPRADIVDCGHYDGEACKTQGVGCVTDG